MDTTTDNKTLKRIQLEIKTIVEREDELRTNRKQSISNGSITSTSVPINKSQSNGMNGTHYPPHYRRVSAPVSSRGIMSKFIKMRGKLSALTSFNASEKQNTYVASQAVGRGGWISAQQKIERELQDFQEREQNLRMERRMSQPDLMSALAAEDSRIPPTSSLVHLYSTKAVDADESKKDSSLSTIGVMKPCKSLSELCDVEEDSLPSFGTTHSLIKQFERLEHR